MQIVYYMHSVQRISRHICRFRQLLPVVRGSCSRPKNYRLCAGERLPLEDGLNFSVSHDTAAAVSVDLVRAAARGLLPRVSEAALGRGTPPAPPGACVLARRRARSTPV